MDIAIIGVGKIGQNLANSLITYHNIKSIFLNNRTRNNCIGFLEELNLIKSELNPNINIKLTNKLSEIDNPDWLILTASENFEHLRKNNLAIDGNDRLNEYKENRKIIKTIIETIRNNIMDTKILVITNPVDLITHFIKSQIPEKVEIYGFGNSLDTFRMSHFISKKFELSKIKGEYFVMGEHGDDMVPILSQAHYVDKELSYFFNPVSLREVIIKHTKKIIVCSGHTTFSCLMALNRFFDSIFHHKESITTLSYYLDDYMGFNNVTFGVPFHIINGKINKPITFECSELELELLTKTQNKMKSYQKRDIIK